MRNTLLLQLPGVRKICLYYIAVPVLLLCLFLGTACPAHAEEIADSSSSTSDSTDTDDDLTLGGDITDAYDTNLKMNPPLRSRADREALVAGIQDGTIEVIATDHAPHTAAEKARGLAGSAMGIVGLETAFPLLYKYLVLEGVITLEKLVALMSVNPRRIFALEGGVEEGNAADFTVLDLGAEYAVDPGTFLSKGRATPFAGWKVQGRAVLTVVGGKEVYDDNYESNR